jgi:hypothetical protein
MLAIGDECDFFKDKADPLSHTYTLKLSILFLFPTLISYQFFQTSVFVHLLRMKLVILIYSM